MAADMLPLCWQQRAHLPTCPLAGSRFRASATCRRRLLATSRGPHTVRAAAVETQNEQQIDLGSDASTSYSNGSPAGQDLTYAMDHASSDVLYKRFFELLDGSSAEVKEGDKVAGVVLAVSDRGAYVELGRKGPAYLHSVAMTLQKGVKVHEVVQPDTAREFVVSDVFSNGDVLVSLADLEAQVLWTRLAQLQQEGVTVKATGTSASPNGLIVSVMGISGFLPRRFMDRNAVPESFVDKDIDVKILEVTEDDERLIVAQKMYMPESEAHHKAGDVVDGKIMSLQPYGAFVNIGGSSDGLLHVSQISHDRVTNLEQVFAVGDVIKVMVLSQEQASGRISLSTRTLEKDPGDMLRNPKKVFENAEETAAAFRVQMEQAKQLQQSEDSVDV